MHSYFFNIKICLANYFFFNFNAKYFLLYYECIIIDIEAEMIVSAAKFGSCIGIGLISLIMSFYGRKAASLFMAIMLCSGPLIMTFAQNSLSLFMGRLISGIGTGNSILLAPIYIAEVSPPNQRGALIIINEVFVAHI